MIWQTSCTVPAHPVFPFPSPNVIDSLQLYRTMSISGSSRPEQESSVPQQTVIDSSADRSLDDLITKTEQLALESGRSNEPLPTSQQRSIQSLIYKTEAELDQLNGEISRILDALGAKRDQVAARLGRYRVAVAPHRNLPSEVLENIFLHHLAHNALNIGLPPRIHGPKHCDAESALVAKSWVILHICKRWRQVALDDPRVWSSLQIYYGSLNSGVEDKSAAAFQLLSKSGDTPLSLSLHLGQKFPDSKRATNPIISLLPNARRIRDLVIKGFPREWLYPLFDLPTGQMGLLETLDLDFMTTDENTLIHLSPSPSTAFDSAPCLWKVRLKADRPLLLSPSNFCCPWGQITDIRFLNLMINVFEAGDMLYDALSLVRCELSLWIHPEQSNSRFDLDVGARVLPSLRSLILDVRNSDVCFVLFEPFSFPSLSHLEIVGQGGHGSSAHRWVSALASLVYRSQCEIEEFSTTLIMPSENFEPLFLLMPHLISLDILLSSRLSASALERMSRGELLTKLEILDCRLESFAAFINYLESCLNSEAAGTGSSTGIRDATIYVDPQQLDQSAYNRFESLQQKLNGREINLQSNQMGMVMIPSRRLRR